MKIVILSPFHPYRGGIAQFSGQLYIELSKRNEVKVFSFTTMYPDFLFPGKTQYVPEEEHSDIETERILSSINPFSYIRTAKRINRFEPDIVIIAYWMPFMVPAYSSVCLLLNKKIRIVALVHNAISHEKHFADRHLAGFFFNRCNAFIVLSKPVEKDVLSLRKKADIVLHPHPIYNHYGDAMRRDLACDMLGIESNKKNLLFFGLIREYKGLDLLIEAMNRLDDSYQLIIAGESYGGFELYSELIEKSRNKKNIKVFEQYIPDSMVSAFFSAADVLVLPYRSATQSGVTAIAIQMELPVIATDTGALGNSIRETGIGLVVGSAAAADIANGVAQFFSGEKSTESYKENLKKEKDRLSWKNFAGSIESFLSGL
jgi:glycosyltransferase involved in cell wall biosynthesis